MNRSIITLIITFYLISCGTQKPATQKVIEKTVRDTIYIEKVKKKDEDIYQAAVLNNFQISDSHFPATGQDYRQKFLIMHYTALHHDRSIEVLTEQAVSSHYLVSDHDDDKIELLVSENRRAWHAGVSEWRGRTNINDSSIGIEIVNPGYSTIEEKMWFYPYTENQIKKIGELAKNIIARYDIDPTYVLGHSDIAPTRKQDPGAFFPWKRLYEEYGVGAWYDDIDKYRFLLQYKSNRYHQYDFIQSVQKDLQTYGYGVESTGRWDEQTKLTLQAFQMHFRPSDYDGELDAETWAILQALNYKYR